MYIIMIGSFILVSIFFIYKIYKPVRVLFIYFEYATLLALIFYVPLVTYRINNDHFNKHILEPVLCSFFDFSRELEHPELMDEESDLTSS
jgi:hypothetical protein